uniref:C2H2-type domain-containing protein n=1 Tax=Amazona collaria TaxID=241587 RepID=A0A8B9FUB2_9PSIT
SWPPLDLLPHLHVLMLRTPELYTALEVRSHESRVEGQELLPRPAGRAPFDAAQDTVGFLDSSFMPFLQELPAELQYEDKESYETYYQKRGESAAGIFVPSSTNSGLQDEDKDLEHCFPEQSEKPQRRLRADNKNTILMDVFDEDLEPVPEEALPYGCKKCGSTFQGLSELQEHKRTHFVENSYQCPVCAKEFFRAANLRMHKLIHSSDRPHKCPECDKGFIQRSMVILGNGMEDDYKPYSCPTCSKGFDKPNLLSKHKVIHRQDKPYKCQECGMAFVQLLRLKRHQQTHSGERPFYCEECGGTFTRLASLQRHHRIHTGEKPYSCSYCGHSFTESGTLRRHERTWAGESTPLRALWPVQTHFPAVADRRHCIMGISGTCTW